MEGREFLINREEILQQQQTLDCLQEDWVEMRRGTYKQVSGKKLQHLHAFQADESQSYRRKVS
jgi:hypothetical protein